MDMHTANVVVPGSAGLQARPTRRSFLFLQGPISNFFDQLGRALTARGHRVHRINLHFGDQIFWRLPATHYRGRFEDWRPFIGQALEEHQVTDLVVHGDRRPYHIVAAEEARARGIAVLSTDLGYVRPDWVTLEYDGMSTYSRFPREPAEIHALAQQFPPPDLMPRFHAPFRLVAALDVIYNLGLVFGRPLYPNYRYHGIYHPFAEYAGWIGSRAKLLFTRRWIKAEKARLQADSGSYFLFPLQLATDFQLRAHSPFVEPGDALRQVIGSFAASCSERKLVCIVHPLDPGITSWHRKISALARDFGVSDRVQVFEGGTPHNLLVNAAGVVTVNSTIGITALHHGVPVKVLGNAVFDIPGLTCQEALDVFWRDPSPPDPELMAAFVRALCGATQIKGGYYDRASKSCAIDGFVERLEQSALPLPELTPIELAARPVRPAARHVLISGLSQGVSLALARAYAKPGTRISLIGAEPHLLTAAAEDCWRRGATADTVLLSGANQTELGERLAELHRRNPVDVLVVHAGCADIGRSGVTGAERRPVAEVQEAMNTVAALAEPMGARGCGRILLVSGLIGRTFGRDLPDLIAGRRALLAYAEALRFRVRARGLSVTAVVPGDFALRAADRSGQPSIVTMGPDRAAERILRGVRRGRAVVAIPCPAAAAMRILCLAPSTLRDWLRQRWVPGSEPLGSAADEPSLGSGAAPGD
jgi:capsular polysaccharide export protein